MFNIINMIDKYKRIDLLIGSFFMNILLNEKKCKQWPLKTDYLITSKASEDALLFCHPASINI